MHLNVHTTYMSFIAIVSINNHYWRTVLSDNNFNFFSDPTNGTRTFSVEESQHTPSKTVESDVHIIGNLPFGIATPLIVLFMRKFSDTSSLFGQCKPKLTLCFQREVGDRLCAPPSTKARCRLSVIAQTYAYVRPSFTIPSKVFVPAPKVEGAVISCYPRSLDERQSLLDFDSFEAFLRAGFQSRRRFLRHPLSKLPGLGSVAEADAFLKYHSVDPNTRPFNLTTHEWMHLAHAYNKLFK